jgi:hypothetical protein
MVLTQVRDLRYDASAWVVHFRISLSKFMSNTRLQKTLELIDDIHRQDPRCELTAHDDIPSELLYAERMTEWLLKLEPNASEALQLAVRGQHLRRWQLARDSYPMDRVGYLRWRTDLKNLHAKELGLLMSDQGYDDETIAAAQGLVKKDRLKQNPEAQLLEDAACLVFLEHELVDFAAKHPTDKVLDILRKTWPKMSPRAQAIALELQLSPKAKEYVAAALG